MTENLKIAGAALGAAFLTWFVNAVRTRGLRGALVAAAAEAGGLRHAMSAAFQGVDDEQCESCRAAISKKSKELGVAHLLDAELAKDRETRRLGPVTEKTPPTGVSPPRTP